MRITILSVGTIKERYLKEAIAEYTKRISKYCKIDFIQVPDEANLLEPSPKELEMIKDKEAIRLLKALPMNSFKIALNLKGEEISSPKLAKKIEDIFSYHSSHITFVIGGSLGLGTELLKQMDYHLCFSKMTFPHQLMQVILLEQIYRAFKINHHEVYHK